MFYIALRMLVGDTPKFIALVFGLAFATTLVVQQGAIFTGIMRRTARGIENVPQAEIWVMDPATVYYDERRPLPDSALLRVRSVTGVAWAVPFFVGGGTAQLPDGSYSQVQIVGVDRQSKIGMPQAYESGDPHMLDDPETVFWDNLNMDLYRNVHPGDTLQVNDHRARVVGLAAAPRAFTPGPVVYTTYERALDYAPSERRRLTFVLAGAQPGESPDVVAQRIREKTGLGAMSSSEFFWATVKTNMRRIPATINFAITILLGLIVGVAVAIQTFSAFVLENTKHFGALKAMGTSNFMLVKMVLMQAIVVGLLGWGLGVGAACVFGSQITPRSPLVFMLTPQLLGISFVAMLVAVMVAALMSIGRILRIEPAIVFR
ncbi:MAG TPA: ABC transporter permease [Planctomycetota bacterium]|jgi:putative ABC transport system permease protein